jgi:lipoate-protein ligase A
MTATTWRILPLEVGDAETLLADGIAAFDALAETAVPTLRWYRSTAPAIVVGRGQADLRLRDVGIAVATRFSGGGAVWLSPDVLSLDVLLPTGHPWASQRLTEAFDHVGGAWVAGLREVGVTGLTVHDGPATARRRGTARQQLLAAVCYATRGRGEVFWHDRKIVGLAQRRRRHGAMVQCGVLRRWRPRTLLTALGADPHDPEIHAAAVGLDDISDSAPTDDDVMAAVSHAFCEAAVTSLGR